MPHHGFYSCFYTPVLIISHSHCEPHVIEWFAPAQQIYWPILIGLYRRKVVISGCAVHSNLLKLNNSTP